MRSFEEYNPAALMLYFGAVILVAMFSMNPLLLLQSLLGALLLFLLRNKANQLRSHWFFFGLFLVSACIAPLFSHNGKTVLFFLNGNRITLEAVIYGLVSAILLLAVLYWFRTVSQIMTTDKWLYLLKGLSPKLALLITMAMRYVPLLVEQNRKINRAQQAIGLYRDDNLPDKLRGRLRSFSILMTWALENGIITADSMTARGYGVGPRTSYFIFHFRKADGLLTLLTLLLTGIVLVGLSFGALEVQFYPEIQIPAQSLAGTAAYVAYGMLVLLPSVMICIAKMKARLKYEV